MLQLPIYLDNHATTRLDPRVLEAMLPYFSEKFGNAGSTTHSFGHAAKEAVDTSRQQIAAAIGARPKEIIFTSGATESNNLAIKGVAAKYAHRGRHIVSVVTEHPAVLDPLQALARHGFEVTLLPVTELPNERAGLIDIERLADALRADTILVSVMLANNEIGAIMPVAEIGRLCRQRGVLLHSDATQAVGKIPVNVEQFNVDLMSFSATRFTARRASAACTFDAAARKSAWIRLSMAAARRPGCAAARLTRRASSASPGRSNCASKNCPAKRPGSARYAIDCTPV